MKKKWLVVDIDGTIADIRQRKYLSAREINHDATYKDVIKSYSLDDVLKEDDLERFFEIFLSEKYMHTDEPIEGAAESLHDLSKIYNIFYLTGRHDELHDSMKDGTIKWLREHGFPPPNNDDIHLKMKPKRKMKDDMYKCDALNEIDDWDIEAGIGNNPSDHIAYTEHGIYSIIIDDPELRDRIKEKEIKTLKNWDDIKNILRNR